MAVFEVEEIHCNRCSEAVASRSSIIQDIRIEAMLVVTCRAHTAIRLSQ